MDKNLKQQFKGDVPIPRFGHTMTFYSKDKICLFGGAVESLNGISMTDTSYSLDMESKEWRKIQTTGLVPSARAAHAAVNLENNKIIIYGGATQKGLASDQLYMLDIKSGLGIWNIIKVGRSTPGKRYGHSMTYSKPYLYVFGGQVQQQLSNDLWMLDVQAKSLNWVQIKFKCEIPKSRYYHSAALCSSGTTAGMIIIYGGKSKQKQALNDCWGLIRHNSTGIMQWVKAPLRKQMQARYQHSCHFVGPSMFVIGGRTNSNQMLPLQVFDTLTNECYKFSQNQIFRHSSWLYNGIIYVNGGFTPHDQTKANKIVFQINACQFVNLNKKQQNDLKSSRASEKSNASSASTKQLFSMLKSVRSQKSQQSNMTSTDKSVKKFQLQRSPKKDKRLCILQPIYGKANFIHSKKNQPQNKKGIANYFLNKLMIPNVFCQTQPNVKFSAQEIIQLCDEAEQIVSKQPMLLEIRAPLKIFGDIHGQFSDLMEFFKLYGSPHEKGLPKDIENYDYIFLGDYVDRGNHSLQTICLLLALKVAYPNQFHLLRGNHEDIGVNTVFGFQEECQAKMEQDTTNANSVYMRINKLFQWFPLAAIVEDKILCIHGGIGKSLEHYSQIQQIKRPLEVAHEVHDQQSQIVLDILWSDPTASDQILGIHPNYPRNGSQHGDIVQFGPDRVTSFLQNNNLSMIIRAHEVVMDGFERFAGGSLITVFSATDYGKRHKNAGCMLKLKTNLQIIPNIIYPKKNNINNWIQEQDLSPKRAFTPPRWRVNN